MNADVGFGWIVLAGFLLWVFQVLRAGSRGGTRRGPSAQPPHVPKPDRTQREGQQLEQMLRHLETRLGQQQPGRAGRKPAPPAQPKVVEAGKAASLQAPVVRTAEGQDLGAVVPAAVTPIRHLVVQQLRHAFVWSEILGPPVGLRQ